MLGMGKTSRLQRRVKKQMRRAWVEHKLTGKPARRFKSFMFRTEKSWSRKRRAVCKAEHLRRGANPRFLVTSLGNDQYSAKTLYEDLYCARGEMENRIKAQQLELFASRVSTHWIASNQLRMYFSTFAYTLLECLRRSGLKGTRYYMAQCDTIRLMLLKVGTVIRTSARRISLSFSSFYPYADLFRHVLTRVSKIPVNS